MTAFITALLVNAAVFSVLLGVMLLARALSGKRLSAALRYALWAAVVVKLLLPFGFESTLSPLSWLPAASSQTVAADTVGVGDSTNTLPAQADVSTQPVLVNVPETEANAVIAADTEPPAAASVQPQTAAQPLSWAEWAFIAWAAGCLACAGWLLLCRVHIQRRVLRCAAKPPAHMFDVFKQCGQELGIRRNVRLRVQSAVGVPAITGIVSPTLIVPVSFADADDATLRHVFLHELTHWKRGDLFMLTLLNLLSCVYWFNPLTWLCCSLIRRDMETVCDQHVLERLSHEARSAYVRTVLHFAGAPANRRLAAALSLNDGRAYMENRIRNMFRTRKTGVRTRIVAICLAALMLAACMLTACQPEDKGHILIKDLAQSQYAEDVSQDIKSQANVTVRIDADVDAPDVDALPIYTIEPYTFTQENLDAVSDYFLPGLTLHRPSHNDAWTEEDIQIMIAGYQAEIERVKTMGPAQLMSEYGSRSKEEAIAGLEDWISALQVYTESQLEGDGSQSWIIWRDIIFPPNAWLADREDGSEAVVGYSDTEVSYQSDASYVAAYLQTGSPNGVSLTQQQAIDASLKALSDMGISGMTISDVNVCNVKHLSNINLPDSRYTEATETQCWGMVFSKDLGGVPARSIPVTQLDIVTGKQKARTWISYGTERIFIAVDDTGVLEFRWTYPCRITGTAAESAPLLPFDDILNIALDRIYYTVDPVEGLSFSVNIHTVQLRYVYVEDRYSVYKLIPVWDFIGDSEVSDDSSTYPLEYDRTFLTVNALDGSVVKLAGEYAVW